MNFDTMTLAEFEALAARMEVAARTIRDAMALMHGGSVAPPPPAPVRDASAPIETNKGPVVFTAAEQAQRRKLLDVLPDDIRAAEGT